MPGNSNLHDSSRNKQDEFYTRRIRKTVQRLNSTVAQPHPSSDIASQCSLRSGDMSPPVGVHEWEMQETHTFAWDGNNIVLEGVEFANGASRTFEYFWGADKSGSEQGAGGVGGLLYLTIDDMPYIPTYDNNGNIARYLDASGNTVAQYTYDAFGKIVAQSGPLVDFFRHRFSTKYYDAEAGLYYYGYRFYHPILMRWMNRDQIGENGGLNLYGFCLNAVVFCIDPLGAVHYKLPSNPFFGKHLRKSVQIAGQVDVLLKSLQQVSKGLYQYRVVFVARFTPPLEVESRRVKQSGFSKFLWGNADVSMGGEIGMYEPSGTGGDVRGDAWGEPDAYPVGGNGIVAPGQAYSYKSKRFQFGYFVYRQERGSVFKMEKSNNDLYASWEVGNANRLLRNVNDLSVSGRMGKCDIVVVQYGDIGCKPGYVVVKP